MLWSPCQSVIFLMSSITSWLLPSQLFAHAALETIGHFPQKATGSFSLIFLFSRNKGELARWHVQVQTGSWVTFIIIHPAPSPSLEQLSCWVSGWGRQAKQKRRPPASYARSTSSAKKYGNLQDVQCMTGTSFTTALVEWGTMTSSLKSERGNASEAKWLVAFFL